MLLPKYKVSSGNTLGLKKGNGKGLGEITVQNKFSHSGRFLSSIRISTILSVSEKNKGKQ